MEDKKDVKKFETTMHKEDELHALASERLFWASHTRKGSQRQLPKQEVAHKVAMLVAARDRADPYTYSRVYGRLMGDYATPQDYFSQFNMTWEKLFRPLSVLLTEALKPA